MAHRLQELRRYVHPRADFLARGPDRPMRASDIILGMTLVMLLVGLVAFALTQLFTAT